MRLIKDWILGDPILELNKSELASLRRVERIADKAAKMLGLSEDQRCEDDLGKLACYARELANATDPENRDHQ